MADDDAAPTNDDGSLWNTARRRIDFPDTAYVEQVVLNGLAFKSRLTVTVHLERAPDGVRSGITAGEAQRMVWRAGWAVARVLDDARLDALGPGAKDKIGEVGWDVYALDAERSTIGNEP